jgi:hypothetical protein
LQALSLILRRLDEIERKLDRMMEELRAPTAIGYSVRRGNRPRKGWQPSADDVRVVLRLDGLAERERHRRQA